MKYITKYKSPNYNSRKNARIKLIVIHYTALKNTQTAIAYLCNKKNKVSAHYLISQDGKVYLLVNERYRAWHAGLSYWNNFKDINSISIGIELDYSPNNKNNKFSQKMISSLIKILFKIQNKYKISKKNILAHSDIAPLRKKDPGKYFPWKMLDLSKITFNFDQVKKSEIKITENWFKNHKINSKKQRIILALSLIGYDTTNVYKTRKIYNKVISAYKLRYINKNYKKINDLLYKTLIRHLFKFLLTKN